MNNPDLQKQLLDGMTEFERPFAEFVMDHCVSTQPKRVLEIGTGWGIFTSSVLASCEAQIVTIDKIPHEQLGDFQGRMKLLGDEVMRVEMVNGESEEVLQHLIKSVAITKQAFDLIYIDGNHSYGYVMADLLNAWQLVKPGIGFIMVDDVIHEHNFDGDYGVTRALWDFMKKEDVAIELYPLVYGTAVLQRAIRVEEDVEEDIETINLDS